MEEASEADELVRAVVGAAMKVHRHFGPGFAEVVYQNAMLLEFRRAKISALCQHPLKVSYNGVVVGEFVADLMIEDRLVVELKSARIIDSSHEAQLVNYLHATGLEVGLLPNFGSASLQFTTKTREFRPRQPPTPDLST